MPGSRIRLCALDEVPKEGSNGFFVETKTNRFGAMVIRTAGELFVYVNSCPHIGTPLDIKVGEFLNIDRSHIICSTHGALFRIKDGYCVSGPCAGDSLIALSATIKDGQIIVTTPIQLDNP